jgi:hypothetical protein
MTHLTPQQLTPIILVAVIIVVVGLRIWRSTREQRFQTGTMWVVPGIFAAFTLGFIVIERYTSPLDIAFVVLALAVGVAIGLYQGTHTTVRVDHAAHAMFVKISPLGSLIFIGVLVLRIAVRYATGGIAAATAATADPGALIVHTTAGLISLLLLVLAVGIIVGLRVYLQRVYDQARATL